MKPDPVRVKSYLADIRRNGLALNQIKTGRNDFDIFVEEIEVYMAKK